MKAICPIAAVFLLCSLCLTLTAAEVPDFKVNDDFSTSYQGYSNIATDLNGDFVVSWYDLRNGNNDIYIQRFSHDGTRNGTNQRVNDDSGSAEQLRPTLMKDQLGKFVVCWQDYRASGYPYNAEIYGQRFDVNGTPQLVNFRVNDDFGTETQGWQDIDGDDFGNFVIVWEDNRNGNYDIYAQRYHKSGVKLGSNVRVNSDLGSAYQHNPKITVDGDGDFVIVWYDNRNGTDNIMGQRYNSSGVAQGGNFLINDIAGGAKRILPYVATDYNGNFTVAWLDYRNGSYPENPDIYGQMFWADGSARGDNFKVNDDVGTSTQAEATIGMDYLGNFLIAWRDERNGDFDIYAQYYHNSGDPLDANYQVNNDQGTATQSWPNVTMDGINIYLTWTDQRNGNYDVYSRIQEYGAPAIVVTPAGLDFSAELGGSNPAAQNLFINNIGYGLLNWQGSSNQSWLTVSPQTGSAPDTVQVMVDVTGLTYGSYDGQITIADASGQDSPRTVVVSLEITAPVIEITPESIIIEAHYGAPPPDDKFVQINNSGSGVLNWQIGEAPAWLGFQLNSGTAPSAIDLVIDTDSLPSPGQYNALIEVTSSEAINSPQSFTVQLDYVADAPVLAIDPDTLRFNFSVIDSVIPAQELVIYNIGADDLSWQASSDSLWVEAEPVFGLGNGLTLVSVTPQVLSVGEYYAQLQIEDPQAYNSPISCVLRINISDVPPVIDVAPDTVRFISYFDGPQDSSREINVNNLGGGTMSWNVDPAAIWFDLDPDSGTGQTVLEAYVQTAGLPIAEYTTWVYFEAPDATNVFESVFVNLQITEWLPKICALPDTTFFYAREMQPVIDSTVITIESCAAPEMNWSITTSGGLVTAVPDSGSAGEQSVLHLQSDGLPVGEYPQEITVSSPEADNSPQITQALLTVAPNDTIDLSGAALIAGGAFVLDLFLENFLPLDSINLVIDFDSSYFWFDSLVEASRLIGTMALETTSSPGSGHVEIHSLASSVFLAPDGAPFAHLYFTNLLPTPDGEYQFVCSGEVLDSLGASVTLNTDTALVEVSGMTPAEGIPGSVIPHDFVLYQNYPNPFNSSTLIRYSLERGAQVEIDVFNILGQVVRVLYQGHQSAGEHRLLWQGDDLNNVSLGTGVYFIRMKRDSESEIIKAVLLK